MMLFGVNYTNINIMKGKENRGALVNYVGRHHQSKVWFGYFKFLTPIW